MTVVHHLDDATLMRFASGDLDEGFAVTIAAHLELCDDACRSALRSAEACGGHFLEQTDAATMSDNAFEQLRDKIHADASSLSQDTAAGKAPTRSAAKSQDAVPKPLQRYVGTSLDDVTWTKIAPGVKKRDITLTSKTSNKLYMLNIAAGSTMPVHGHGGSELTLVLSGAYQDHHGRFARGDIADLDEHDEHQPKVEGDQPCICLVAAEGHTKPRGFFARLLRPLIGI